jgi:hypothetical protein
VELGWARWVARTLTPKNGDFVFSTPDQRLLFEVGGPKKGFGQIGEVSNHYVVADATFTEVLGRVPLWLFGFLG